MDTTDESDVERALAALDSPPLAYRSFATEERLADAAAGEAVSVEFPLLAAALPETADMAVPAPRAAGATAPAPAPPPAPIAVAPPATAAPPPPPPRWEAPVPPAQPAPVEPPPPFLFSPAPAPTPPTPPPQSSGARTLLGNVFRVLRGSPPQSRPAAEAPRGLHDMFRRL